MTLNLTVVNQYGAWQCSDHRLTDRNGKPSKEGSIKHIPIICPDGTILLTYCGVGTIASIHISDWLLKILRGETRTVSQTLDFIHTCCNENLSNIAGIGRHMFTIGGFINRKPFICEIRNFEISDDRIQLPPEKRFRKAIIELPDGGYSAFPSITDEDDQLLMKILGSEPKSSKELSQTLIEINKRKAGIDRSVSPNCLVSYMPPDGKPIETISNNMNSDDSIDEIGPILIHGIDASELMKGLLVQVNNNGLTSNAPDKHISKKEGGESIKRKNLLEGVLEKY